MGALVGLVIQELPQLIDSVRTLFVQQNPGAPLPTDEDVIAAYQQALASSLARDAAWLAQHPEPTSDQ